MPTPNATRPTLQLLFGSQQEEFYFLNGKIRDACTEASRLMQTYKTMPNGQEKLVMRQRLAELEESFNAGELKRVRERVDFLYRQLSTSYPDFPNEF